MSYSLVFRPPQNDNGMWQNFGQNFVGKFLFLEKNHINQRLNRSANACKIAKCPTMEILKNWGYLIFRPPRNGNEMWLSFGQNLVGEL